MSDIDYQCRQNRAKFSSQLDDKYNTKNTKTFTERKIPKHLPNLATFEPEFLKGSAISKKGKTCAFLLKS
ncbi:hypothetical protein EG862_08730 [Enterococcus faecium]|nr:hypothetical protein EG862_08730 [Enterococcus faecium]RXW47336.1 hypothetical protein CYQ81_09805 [Enterococcus faecium]